MDIPLLSERIAEISKKLVEFFGTDVAPWDMINTKFFQYGFKHKILEPQNIGKYHPKFVSNLGDEISFNDLSSGEQVIAQLVLWSYDSADERKTGNRNKLLMMDEFDAHLNPSMAKMFIEIVKSVLVGQFKMQVIMCN